MTASLLNNVLIHNTSTNTIISIKTFKSSSSSSLFKHFLSRCLNTSLGFITNFNVCALYTHSSVTCAGYGKLFTEKTYRRSQICGVYLFYQPYSTFVNIVRHGVRRKIYLKIMGVRSS